MKENKVMKKSQDMINQFYGYVKNYLDGINVTVADEKILDGINNFYDGMLAQIKENNEDNFYIFYAVGADKKEVPVFTVFYKKDEGFFTCEGEWDFDEE